MTNISCNSRHGDENEPLLTSAPSIPVEHFPLAQHGGTRTSFYWKLAATMFDFFASGMAMAAIGVLIPDVEREYSLKDDKVAFIFPAGVIGYLAAAALAQHLTLQFGRRGIAVLSPTTRLLASGLLATPAPFGVILAAYCLMGFGTGLTDTAWNAWASRMPRPNVVQGFLHGSFAVGCVVSPPMTSLMLREGGWHWFYYGFVLLSVLELLLQGWAFRHDFPRKAASVAPSEAVAARRSLLKDKSIWLCALFYLSYQGVEASLTDWIVVYMQRSRHTSPATSSTATSIFWIGMALGRYALGLVTEFLGLKRAVTAYIISATILQVALLLVTNTNIFLLLLGGIGFFIATVFPSGIILLVQKLDVPPQEQTGLVAVAIGAGQVGAAVAPLGVGFLSARLGIGRLLEVLLVFSGLMLVTWLAFSRVRGQDDEMTTRENHEDNHRVAE